MKVSRFVWRGFSHKRNHKSWLKLHTKEDVLPTYRMMPRMFGFPWLIADFEGIPINHYFEDLIRLHRCTQQRNTSILSSLNRCILRLAPRGIWRWFIHLCFERSSNSLLKFGVENRRVFFKKKVKWFQIPTHPDFSDSCNNGELPDLPVFLKEPTKVDGGLAGEVKFILATTSF